LESSDKALSVAFFSSPYCSKGGDGHSDWLTPTGTVTTTVLVAVSITETEFEPQ
jgi:hypothetical protein